MDVGLQLWLRCVPEACLEVRLPCNAGRESATASGDDNERPTVSLRHATSLQNTFSGLSCTVAARLPILWQRPPPPSIEVLHAFHSARLSVFWRLLLATASYMLGAKLASLCTCALASLDE